MVGAAEGRGSTLWSVSELPWQELRRAVSCTPTEVELPLGKAGMAFDSLSSPVQAVDQIVCDGLLTLFMSQRVSLQGM